MSQIDPTARVCGQSLVLGPRTRIGRGAVIENSYCRDAVIEAGAVVVDSIVLTEGEPARHRCDAAGRWVAGGAPVAIGEGAAIESSLLRNTAVGPGSRCTECALDESTVGPRNTLRSMKGTLIRTEDRVSVRGPTEVSEAWLGHHTSIDACGYFEGVFSNEFHVVEFDERLGRLSVVDTVSIPHVSRYGMNTIMSTNSGKLLPQPEGVLRTLGPPVRLWHDPLLSHEPIMLGPCCWVHGWTKVIGQSPQPHAGAAELLEDALATYVMPFAAAGLEGGAVQAQIMPGESNGGYGLRQRRPGWVFTYAPGAVIAMVRRLAEAAPSAAADIDSIVVLSLKNALALTRFWAHRRGYDAAGLGGRRYGGWKGWLAESYRILTAHLASGLWEFKGCEPVSWRHACGTWTPADPAALLAIAPDALERQRTEDDLLRSPEPPIEQTFGASRAELAPTLSPTHVAAEATISEDAYVGPGVQITGASVVEKGAWLYRAIVKDSRIEAGVRLERSVVLDSTVGAESRVVSSTVAASSLGAESTVTCARLRESQLAGKAAVSPFADICATRTTCPAILGGRTASVDIATVFMSMHMAGQLRHVKALPASVAAGGGVAEVVHAVPMVGGGARLLGAAGAPVVLDASFIGSNAILDAGALVGFGSFVLGRLGSDEGLPPFTISTSPGPAGDQVGAVLDQFPSLIMTHLIGWTYQANGPEKAHRVAGIITSAIQEGREAVAAELARRTDAALADARSSPARYKSLSLYTDTQLLEGLATYDRALSDGCWEMAFVDGTLRFTGRGVWGVSEGRAQWRGAEGSGAG
ncbi:MAG TPA: hypothetical protein DCM87_14765 [Planctomycetes bacterium]|nr:hypothetical protein [Planctomycetota bacterium]